MGKWTVYVDLDGVLADFDRAAGDLGFDTSDLNMSSSQLTDDAKIRKQRLYDLIAFSSFYAELPFMPDAKALWAHIEPYEPIVLTASPNFRHRDDGLEAHNHAADQKRIWCRNYLGLDTLERVICTRSKEKQTYAKTPSGESAILIDDRPRNISEWENSGGRGILHTSAAESIEALTTVLKSSA